LRMHEVRALPHRLDQIEFGGRTMRALFRACSCAQPKPACLILDSFSKASDLVLGYSMETKKGTPRWRPSNWSERWLLLFNHNGFAVTARILRDTRRGAIRDRHPHLDVMGASSQAGEHCGHWGVDILGRILREEQARCLATNSRIPVHSQIEVDGVSHSGCRHVAAPLDGDLGIGTRLVKCSD